MPFAYYQRLSPRQKTIYRASDGIDRIEVRDAPLLRRAVSALEEDLKTGNRTATQRAAQSLTDLLTDRLGVSPIRVKVLHRRPSWRTGELHGLYEVGERGPHVVSVWMHTAQRVQIVKFKTFLRTLLHELCHHLDYERFGLDESFHTEGFYKRESSLLRQLYPSVEPVPKP